MVKPFLEQKTYKKVRFVYSDNPESQKIMPELFDMDKLESTFGGRNQNGFDFTNFADRMKEDDKKMAASFSQDGTTTSALQRSLSPLSNAHSEDSFEDSSSTNAASPKTEDDDGMEKIEFHEMLEFKSIAGNEIDHIESIQMK